MEKLKVMYNKILAIVRPIGHHKLNILVNEKYSLFKHIIYITNNLNADEWRWLNLRKIELINLKIEPLLLLDPIYIRDGCYGLTSWAYLKNLEKYLLEADFIDTAEVFTFFSYQCARISQKLGKPLIVSAIETIPKHITSYVPPYSLITKYVGRRADLFVVPSVRSRDYLVSIGIKEGKIRVIPFGVDVERFYPKQDDAKREIIRILFVSPLTEKRGLPYILYVFPKLCSEYKNLELWICGKGPLEGLVKEFAKKYPIRYLGFVPWMKIPEIYRMCDIFVLPSRDIYRFGIKLSEDGQWTTVVLEAMASGLPLIVSDSGTYPEMVGSDNFIVAQGDVKQLYESLRILVEDEALRRKIGASNRMRAEELFDGKKCCESYAKAVMELLE